MDATEPQKRGTKRKLSIDDKDQQVQQPPTNRTRTTSTTTPTTETTEMANDQNDNADETRIVMPYGPGKRERIYVMPDVSYIESLPSMICTRWTAPRWTGIPRPQDTSDWEYWAALSEGPKWVTDADISSVLRSWSSSSSLFHHFAPELIVTAMTFMMDPVGVGCSMARCVCGVLVPESDTTPCPWHDFDGDRLAAEVTNRRIDGGRYAACKGRLHKRCSRCQQPICCACSQGGFCSVWCKSVSIQCSEMHCLPD